MHLFAINLNILADHVDNFLLQLRQVIGLVTLATFVGAGFLRSRK